LVSVHAQGMRQHVMARASLIGQRVSTMSVASVA